MRGTLLGQRDVRLIVGAVGVSALGDFVLWIPLTLQLRAMTGSGIAVAGLFLALWTPVVVLAPLAGLLVDRLEARGFFSWSRCSGCGTVRSWWRLPPADCWSPRSEGARRWDWRERSPVLAALDRSRALPAARDPGGASAGTPQLRNVRNVIDREHVFFPAWPEHLGSGTGSFGMARTPGV
jgi:hypothetical protein